MIQVITPRIAAVSLFLLVSFAWTTPAQGQRRLFRAARGIGAMIGGQNRLQSVSKPTPPKQASRSQTKRKSGTPELATPTTKSGAAAMGRSPSGVSPASNRTTGSTTANGSLTRNARQALPSYAPVRRPNYVIPLEEAIQQPDPLRAVMTSITGGLTELVEGPNNMHFAPWSTRSNFAQPQMLQPNSQLPTSQLPPRQHLTSQPPAQQQRPYATPATKTTGYNPRRQPTGLLGSGDIRPAAQTSLSRLEGEPAIPAGFHSILVKPAR